GHSAIHDSCTRMGRLLSGHLRIFTIETTLNNDTFPSPFEFMNKREWEWSFKDQASYLAAKRANERAPGRMRREVLRRVTAPSGAVGVPPGAPPLVHRLLRRGARRDDRSCRDRGEVRGAVRAGSVVRAPVPQLLRVPRRASVLHVVLGRACDGVPARRDLRG